MTYWPIKIKPLGWALTLGAGIALFGALAACEQSPTANALNKYCESGTEGAADAVADSVAMTLNTYLQTRGFKGSISRIEIDCLPVIEPTSG